MLQNCQMPTPILPRNPVRNITVLSFVSAIIRLIGNIFKLLIVMGGKRMRNLSIISKNKLTSGLEIFLAGRWGYLLAYIFS